MHRLNSLGGYISTVGDTAAAATVAAPFQTPNKITASPQGDIWVACQNGGLSSSYSTQTFGYIGKIPNGLGSTYVYPNISNPTYGAVVLSPHPITSNPGSQTDNIFFGNGETCELNFQPIVCSMPNGYFDTALFSCAIGGIPGAGTYSDRFGSVRSVWVSRAGNIYVADNNINVANPSVGQMR